MASRPFVDVLFGPYLPDLGGAPNHQIPGYLVDAINIRSTPNGWRGMPTFALDTSTAIGTPTVARAIGSCFVTDAKASIFFVVKDDGNLYQLGGGASWDDNSPASGAALDEFGDFARFGDHIVFIGDTRAPIYKDLTDPGSTNFEDLSNLGGSPPIANVGARVRNHLVLGGISTDLYAIQTSAIGDHTDWPTPGTADARAKQSIYESLSPDYGFVRRIAGGEKIGLIFQDNAITRMTYVGGSVVYAFDTIETVDGIGRGAKQTLRPTTDGKFWYWYNETGVFVTDGYQVRNLSDGSIAESLFINSLSHPNGSSLDGSYNAVYDSRRDILIFGGRNNSGGSRYQLIYSVSTGSFSLTNDANEVGLFSGYSSSLGRLVYYINASDSKLYSMTGATGTIALQTGYIELDPGYRFQFQGAHLLGNGGGSLALGYKTAASESACDSVQTGFSSTTAATLGQKKTARASSQYIAFRVTGTGAESQLLRGIRVYFERAEPSP